ncbi:hypothetical protein AND_010536 [Anopheles darlingi]|uniref:Secreted protein n=1 Tax=Anopheles darlingi TaxID=43151 RepID=W5J168_ANODA|nr:hypothetical protein AND_010536 [Anopheles darlingi]
MSKLNVTLLFIGLSMLVVWTEATEGDPFFRENYESNESTEWARKETKRREQCIKNTGSDAAYTEYTESFYKFLSCSPRQFQASLSDDFDQLTNETRGAFYSKYCARVPSVVSCLEESLMGMQPCLKQGTSQIAAAFVRSIPEAADLGCKNDGEILFQLKDEKRKECLNRKADEISICMSIFTERVSDLSALTRDHCSIFKNVKSCVTRILKYCDFEDLVSIFDVSVNAMLGVMPCGSPTKKL